MSLASFLDRWAADRPIPRRKKRFRPPRFYVEALEGRVLLTTYTVNSTDPGLGGAGVNTLVEAIATANADTTDSNPFVINFDIPTSDSGYNATTGVWTFALIGFGLPVITHSVVIDATTQPGYNGKPLIELDGTKAIQGVVQGLEFHVGGNTVKGLDIANSENFGIVLDGTNDPNHNTGPGLNNIIQACYIGTDPTGETAAPNFGGGIDLVNSSYNLIGGLNLASPGGPIPGQLVQGNLISGNGLTGIFLENQGDTHNYIEGDYIGTDVSGMKALDATNLPAPLRVTDGIFLGPALGHLSDGFASNNEISDFDPVSKQFNIDGRNVIAGNASNGVYILGGTGNQVAGNYIGIASDGATPVPNGEDGVRLEDASSNLVGLTQAGGGNVISGNLRNGVEIVSDAQSEEGLAMPLSNQSSLGNVVQSNKIGTNAAGTAAVPNGNPSGGASVFGNGVLLQNLATDSSVEVANNRIGGVDADDGVVDGVVAARNIISGSLSNGVELIGPHTDTNLIEGNYIGTDVTGEKPLANQQNGVYVTNPAGKSGAPFANHIGSGQQGDLGGNVISANMGDGIRIDNGATATVMNGNIIGADGNGKVTDADGTPSSGDELGNQGNGVTIDQAAGNHLGEGDDWGANIIGGNLHSGVLISGANAQNNTLQRNLIGVGAQASGYPRLPNSQGGVRVTGAFDGDPSNNVIGGTSPAGQDFGNVISANHLDGIFIDGGATLTQIIGNNIGTDPTDTLNLGNDRNGIYISNSANNVVGGPNTPAPNVIVNNGSSGVKGNAGVLIQGGAATRNTVLRNYIGISTDGMTAQPNQGDGFGVLIDNAPLNVIGEASVAGSNLISGNAGAGVRIQGSQATGNVLLGNDIGTSADGKNPVPNKGDGVDINNGASLNIIGALAQFGGNVISGNNLNGVDIFSAGVGNVVQNDYLGLNAAGTGALSQSTQFNGVVVDNTPGTVIGGASISQGGNVISGNTSHGIFVGGTLSVGTQITGNYIGTDKNAASAVANPAGVVLSAGSSVSANDGPSTNTTVSGNTIAGNTSAGVVLISGTSGDIIISNFIGTNSQSITTIGNQGAGILIASSPSNFIGQLGAGNTIAFNKVDPSVTSASGQGVRITGANSTDNKVQANTISDNAGRGVQLDGGANAKNIIGGAPGLGNTIIRNVDAGIEITGQGTNNNVVLGNLIGIDKNNKPAGNQSTAPGGYASGVLIEKGAAFNVIGGSSAVAANFISANGFGVGIDGNNNTVAGNYIGTDLNGKVQASFGNILVGIDLFSGQNNTIGGEAPAPGIAPGNKILGNREGIVFVNATGNIVRGNEIANSQGVQNSSPGTGVLVESGALNNVVGGPDNADANSIHDNLGDGVDIQAGTSGISILHNSIFNNTGLGIHLEQPANGNQGGNNLQVAPVLWEATTGQSHRLAGWLINAEPNTIYAVEFFTGTASEFTDNTEDDDAEKLFVPSQNMQTPGANVNTLFKTVTTNSGGVAIFDLVLPANIAADTVIRATATDPSGNTSAFSNAVSVLTDSDGDGIPDAEETGSPAGLSSSASVASFQDSVDPQEYITLQAPAGITLQNVLAIPNPSPNDAPHHNMFGLGFVDFTLAGISPGQHVAVTMTLPVQLTDTRNYWRYGKTPQVQLPHWYIWNYDPATDTGAEINGNTITLHFVNGALGDDDLDPNNSFIRDAGGPGFPGPFTVTNTADSGPGSLRQAILNANANASVNPAANEITFDIPGPAPHKITVLSPLPAITGPLVIDGFRLPPQGSSDQEGTTPQAELDGSQAGPNANGLTLESGFVGVQGLTIDHFSGDGVLVQSAGAGGLGSFGDVLSGMTIEDNGGYGVEINNAPSIQIGTHQTAGGNVISGNAAGGVYIHGTQATGNSLSQNLIGVEGDGTTSLPNGGPGVLVAASASGTSIGSEYAQVNNTIAFNTGPGVEVLSATGTTIEANSIFANHALGVDIGGDGVTPNSTNGAQNFPVLSQVASYGGRTYITGTLASTPQSAFTLDFFASAVADPSGFGQGQVFLGSISATTDTSGNASFNANLETSVSPGWYITATATGVGTSEFSAAFKLPALQPLVLTVNTPDDVDAQPPDPAHFSLREAIEAANTHPGQDIIRFNLPDQTRTITPLTPLPDITDPVIIDGTTQPGFRGLPLVELDGSKAGAGADGLRITGGGSIVRGLIVHSFQQAGIELAGGGGSTIEGTFLGTDATGTSAMSDPFGDVYVNGSNDNLIGGTTAAARNVVASVVVNGYDNNTGRVEANAGGNCIEGNYIGADVTGLALLSGVAAKGVSIEVSSGNTIGGTEPGAGNLILGSLGIFDASSNVVQGNLIGTNYQGTAALAGGGVTIDGEAFSAENNLIGGATPAARNIIVGTVDISGRLGCDNTVEGNYIGTDITGTVALGPAVGVKIESASNTIGGADPGAGNLISGNASAGILLSPSANGNTIAGNLIGTDASGAKPLGNGNYGIWSQGYNNTIGGDTPGAGNVISGNLTYSAGIVLGGVSGDRVEGNFIGTDSTGTIALGNHYGDGIDVEENNAIVGGSQPGAGNVISGNKGSGIVVKVGGFFPSGVAIQGNKIGTDVTGAAPLGNGGDGISISGSAYGVIGGEFPGAGNLISANGGDGIRIADTTGDVALGHASIGTVIQGNTIGVDATGTRPMGNAGDGVSIITSNYVASGETVGGVDPGAGNLVAFNGGRGVRVPFGNGNAVRGNEIYANGGLGLITDINSTLSTYAEARGIAFPHTAPVLTSAVFNPQRTVVSGTFNGAPLTTYGIDLFSNDAVHASGFGDGQTYLESISVLTDQNGSGAFQIPLDAAVPVGKWITATATPEQTPPVPPSGPVPIPYPNTSGFSQPVAVVAAVDASDLQFTAPTYIATENGGAAVVTVTRTGSTAGTATVAYATSDGSAMAGTDYTATSGTLTFNDGETSKTITVPVPEDGVADASKRFQINLTNASGASLGSVSQAAVTIADDTQAGQIAFASPRFTIDRSLNAPELLVTRTGSDHGRVTVDFRVTGGTAVPYISNTTTPTRTDKDYEDNFGTVTFEDGQTTATISFFEVFDVGLLTHLYHGPRTIEVTLGNPTGGATLGATISSVLTIDDEEFLHGAFAASGLFPTNAGVPENAGSAQIEVIRSGQLTTTESVSYATMDGTAKARTNYIAKSGSLIFQPGQYQAFINIPLIPDRVVANPGDFQVLLSNPTGGSFIFPGHGSVDVPILDSDVPPPERFVVVSQAYNEDSSVAQVTVERFPGLSDTVRVNYATSDGTATAGQDYRTELGTLTFTAGQTSQTFSVPILRHNFVGNKTFYVTLSNPTGGATLDPANPATETLFGTPGQAQIASASYPVAENNDQLTVTIPFAANFFAIPGIPANSVGVGSNVTVDYATHDGTAKAGVDYTAVSGTLTFSPNSNVPTVTIPIKNELVDDGDETFYLTLSNPTGGITLGSQSTTAITILETNLPQQQPSTTTLTSAAPSGSTYGQTVNFTATVSAAGGTPTGSVDFVDQTTGKDLGTAKLAVVNGVDEAGVSAPGLTAGSHTIVASYTSDATGFANSHGSFVQLVNPATLTVAADNKSKVYGSANPPLTDMITGFVNGDTSSVVSGSATLSATATAASGVGSYPITSALGTLSAANYTFAFVNGNLSVTPATLTVTADGKTKVYGSANPPLTDTITGFVNGDTASVVNGAAGLSTTATSASGVGSYSITVAQGTLSAANYTFAFVNGNLSITPATLTVTGDNKTKLYGQANPPLTDTITGFVNGDTSSVVSGSASLNTLATAASGVGNYPITVALGTLSAANYTFDFANGNMSITPATLAVTADNKTKVYGQANPPLTDTITGFVNGDTSSVVSGSPTLSTTATSASGVGNYTITVGLGALSAANYTFAFINGNLSITPASLTATAVNKTKVFGQANPPLTDTITGFVNGDTLSVVSGSASLSTTATTASGVGNYPITVGQGTLSAANYMFALVNGVLTVNQDSTTTTVGATVFGLSVTFTATVTANAPGSGTPTGSVDFFDVTTNTELGSAVLSGGTASLTATLPDTTQSITVTYTGDTNFVASSAKTSVSPLASVYVLNPSASGALAASGNAGIEVPGVVVDDSGSSTAITANGNVKIAAGAIDVVGGVRSTGHASFNPAPVTGHAVVPDPYRNLAAPSGGTSLGDISLAGNSSLTIHPGVYTRINVSGNAKLTMTAGVYAIAGGGFSVSGNASVSGSQVIVYNAGGNYLGGSGFGAISLSGNGQTALSAPTAGPYAGVLFFQARDNTQGLTLSGNAVNGLSGTIYAANAPATLSGNATLNLPMVVNTLTLSGNAVLGDPPGDPLSATTALSGSGLALSGFELSPLANVPVATFASSDTSETASSFNATIDWGDGSSSPGAVTLSNDQFTVSGSHTYGDEGSYSIVVSISDGQASTTIAATAKVAEELLAEGTPGTADQRFISEIYRDVLGRQAEPQGRDFWVSHLARGENRAKVVQDILAAVTEEYHRDLIRSEFDRYLHRAPDPTAMRFFTSLLDEGGDATMLDAIIVSSPEYFQEHGRTLNRFVDALFHDALGRPVDPAALTTVETRAAQGATRAAIADVVFSSEEYRRDLVLD